MAKTKLCVDLNGICNEMCRKLNYHVSNVEMISSSSMFALFCFVFSYAFLGVCFGFASFSLFRFDINVARTIEIRRKKKRAQNTQNSLQHQSSATRTLMRGTDKTRIRYANIKFIISPLRNDRLLGTRYDIEMKTTNWQHKHQQQMNTHRSQNYMRIIKFFYTFSWIICTHVMPWCQCAIFFSSFVRSFGVIVCFTVFV